MTDNAESTPNSTTERITRHGNMIVRRAEELEYWVRVDAPGMTREQLDALLPGYSPEIVEDAAAGVLAARYYATTLEQLHAIMTDALRLPPDVAVTLQSLLKWQKSTQQQPGETPPQQPPSETPPAE